MTTYATLLLGIVIGILVEQARAGFIAWDVPHAGRKYETTTPVTGARKADPSKGGAGLYIRDARARQGLNEAASDRPARGGDSQRDVSLSGGG